ncbi:MAG: glycosyltransferase [Candidatus Latescibacterota bacterium]
MSVLLLVLWTGCLGYIFLALSMRHALGKVRGGRSNHRPFVSVVAAARNEEKTIVSCLAALRKQDYPPERYEVIVIDDRSNDGTPVLLEKFRQTWPSLRIITISAAEKGISPKKAALARGIALAQGEIILQTDADCIVPETWISGMASRFEPEAGFVAGIAPYRSAPGMLNSFIRHEYLWNAALSAASIALGGGTHASGRNMGFRKDVFEMLGGYGNSREIISGDDTLLLQRIVRSGQARAVTMPDPGTHVYTDAPENFGDFVRQRTRHMSTGRYFKLPHLVLGSAVYGFHALLLTMLALSVFYPNLIPGVLIAFIGKTAADALIARKVQTTLGFPVQWARFIPNEFLLLAYMTVLPLAGLALPVVWKEKPASEPAPGQAVNRK